MRFLSYLFGVLVLVNLVVLAWPQQNTSAPHLSVIQEEVNPHFIRLNKEIETRFYSQSSQTIEVDDSEAVNDVKLVTEYVESPSDAAHSSACYRVGPFAHRANYELAQAVLYNAKIEYRKSRRKSHESNVTRLYMGPYDGKDEVDEVRLKLREAGILDHFVRKQGALYIISLGIYSSDDSSAAALKLFQDKISPIQQRKETVVLPESYWLHFSLNEEQSGNRQFDAMDWGEPSAKMGLHECLNG